jgi:hypothetical protein
MFLHGIDLLIPEEETYSDSCLLNMSSSFELETQTNFGSIIQRAKAGTLYRVVEHESTVVISHHKDNNNQTPCSHLVLNIV